MCAKKYTAFRITNKMSYSIQQMEMRLHAIADRMEKVEHENKILKQQIAELNQQLDQQLTEV